ncbi:MAG: hypothetical protein KGL19_01975 [Bacteroidota bacterium]|nr:hypothetical protein [Bacteroidota bacterium]
MKAKLNLTIDDNILTGIKEYATKRKTSVSELTENYFKNLMKPSHSKRKNILQLVEKLETPSIDVSGDLKDLFYKDNAQKHGF